MSRRSATPWVLGILAALVLAAALLSVSLGAIRIPPERVLAALTGEGSDPARARDALVILSIRLPRTLLGLLVGSGLAVSGALMQGLFRNPLADPALVGVSSGAGLAAAVIIVLGDRILARLGVLGPLPYAALPAGAFLGGLCATLILYALATRSGRTAVATMLLAGIALGALSGALTGLLTFVSDDRQLRDLAFWSLGSLGGATWSKVAASAPLILPVLAAVPLLGRGLNALVLGEAEAFHLGVPVERLKRACIVLVAVAVGASVAAAGVIGFVGLVVPHALRLLIGPGHRLLLPAAALLGGAFLVLADVVARLVAAPAELPIGIVTALVGAPVFLWLLLGRVRVDDV
ncbi:iron complex transport system permease protein [Methylobacterium sp. PvP062]|uniref:Iron complex transport system permease protein n=1 Tax=Methylobacterium radiotolerans TaxID=31998 RepID=A0ABV2NGJ2_9HYPH|nr:MULTISPECIES: iron ABC transporter permease [unclassified Methylobacterium]MBP2497703.1 iron complex transport system permease protein [Methylobacterium sp. PvP105]MBP2502426.1 iron complex transport system permease protein [Methylobacterium sp. PvP109]MCX7335164.1 iron ABC transporter permease [Hyphomicrobiales bacterium]RUP20897.1 MAG: iron ABC transporter permease [Methylobacterium sp.]